MKRLAFKRKELAFLKERTRWVKKKLDFCGKGSLFKGKHIFGGKACFWSLDEKSSII